MSGSPIPARRTTSASTHDHGQEHPAVEAEPRAASAGMVPGRSVRWRPYLGSDVPPFSPKEEAPELDPDEQPTVELPALEQAVPEQHKEAA